MPPSGPIAVSNARPVHEHMEFASEREAPEATSENLGSSDQRCEGSIDLSRHEPEHIRTPASSLGHGDQHASRTEGDRARARAANVDAALAGLGIRLARQSIGL
jgi:hypothetical protein